MTFEAWLAERYCARTARLYAGQVRRSGGVYVSGLPGGTAAQLRAALRAWASWRGVELVLPVETRRPSVPRPRAALEGWEEAVTTCSRPVVRAVLLLLPETGWTIAALCVLERTDYVRLPATPRVQEIMADWAAVAPESPWLFPGIVHAERALSVDTVHKALRRLRDSRTWTETALRRVFQAEPDRPRLHTGTTPTAFR
jgi:hypothetical protein